ncbi:MAG: hypothetical protein WA252_08490, partial [Candidatus Sulfotelmatobacter sp.]
RKSRRHERINSILWCAQAVLSAAEDMKEAAVGASSNAESRKAVAAQQFGPEAVARFLLGNADLLEKAQLPNSSGISVAAVASDAAATLRKLAGEIESQKSPRKLEDLERHLTVLEEKLFAVLLAALPDDEIVSVRAQADRELAPYRSKMSAAQIDQLQKQYVHKRLLEKFNLPRLSLFYM